MREALYIVVAREMPELDHWPGHVKAGSGPVFDVMKSEVAEWIVNQPEVRQWLFTTLARKGVIKFDKIKRLWSGAPYMEPEKPIDSEMGRPEKYHGAPMLNCLDVPRTTKDWMNMAMDGQPMSQRTFYRIMRNLRLCREVKLEGGLWSKC